MTRWYAVPRDDIAAIVSRARVLVEAFERRSETSQRSTLAEEDALFNLWFELDQRVLKAKP